MIRTRNAIGAVALAAAAFCQASDAAVSVAQWAPGASTEGMGSFQATVTYTHLGGTTASVDVLLLNDTAPALGGFITGLALNPASGVTSLAFVSCTNGNFNGLAGPVSAAPYGSFAAAGVIGSSWLGSGPSGGSPSAGIGVGGSATFSFGMTGTAAVLGALTAEDVFDTVGHGMAVRFRGGEGGWSDKVLGHPMPAPGAVSLLALAGFAGVRRRRF